MEILRRALRRLTLLLRHASAEDAMRAEIRHHLDLETADLVRQGWSAGDARREAARRFGGVEAVKEEGRDARGTRAALDLAGDLRYAVRMLRRDPALTIAAVATFGLGLGAATTIFSVVYGVLLRPLPFGRPDRLVVLWERDVARNRNENVVSLDNFEAWQERARVFAAMGAIIPTSATFTDGPEPERVVGADVTADYFRTLGVSPALGRDFTRDDERDGLAIILADAYWKRRFGSDPAVIGRVRTISGRPYTIVGVMPGSFDPPRFSWLGTQDVWFPMPRSAERRGWGRSLLVIARLRDDVTIERAREEMTAVAARLETERPTDKGWSAGVVPLAAQLTGDASTTLLILLAAVSLLLAMAIANVATLNVAALRRRAAELAVRRAIGATDRRVFRQLLVQSALLAAIGAAAGLAAASAGVRLMIAMLPPETPRLSAIQLDAPVLIAATLACALATVIVGAAAAWGGRSSAASLLTQGAGHARTTTRSSGAALISIEIAVAVALGVAAILMVRTLAGLRAVDLGFDPAHVAVLRIGLPADRYAAPASQRAFFDALVERTRALPGVAAAGLISVRPFGGMGPATTAADARRAASASAPLPVVDVRVADGALFDSLRIPIAAGRGFDRTASPAGPTPMIVSDGLARHLWPNGAIGQRLTIAMYGELTGDVIGVVPDVHLLDPRTPARPAVFLPASRFPDTQRDLVVRVIREPEAIVPVVRAAVTALDAAVPVYMAAPLPDLVARSLATDRLTTFVLGSFAAAALLLAAVGIVGVFTGEVLARRKEIGIRLALGARESSVIGTLLWQALRRAIVGVAAGTVLAANIAGGMKSLLFGITPLDPLTFSAVIVLVLMMIAGATLIPARRAVRRSPLSALREG